MNLLPSDLLLRAFSRILVVPGPELFFFPPFLATPNIAFPCFSFISSLFLVLGRGSSSPNRSLDASFFPLGEGDLYSSIY